ncbi:TetR/AcrR family transcriptional regulator [Sporichthya brevicatena]|uniref:TetR/AcrR family transcriptional regulator n=1 Tax=Sporichthya brevicatena TaxID=171442 RepID=A0ABP3R783_9ACTN
MASPSAGATAPDRNTRPRNRRELLRTAAAELFAQHGYANVSMADVAAAVNVGTSAVYHHYSGKAELLYDAIDGSLERAASSLPSTPVGELSEAAGILAALILDDRALGVLWQRESGNLGSAERARLGKKFLHLNTWLVNELRAFRPELPAHQMELLAVCALQAMTSVAFHHLSLPRRQYERLLADLATRVMSMDPPPAGPKARPRRAAPVTRVDEIIDAGIKLFARKGYADTSIDDIGAAVGIAGPTIYNHFASKHDILVAALLRGHDQLQEILRAARAEGVGPGNVLRRLSDAYVDLALDQTDLIGVLSSESVHLGDEAASRRVHEIQRAYIQDWVAIARAHNSTDSPTVARIKVQAAQMMANDVARASRLRRVPNLRTTVREAAWLVQQ